MCKRIKFPTGEVLGGLWIVGVLPDNIIILYQSLPVVFTTLLFFFRYNFFSVLSITNSGKYFPDHPEILEHRGYVNLNVLVIMIK